MINSFIEIHFIICWCLPSLPDAKKTFQLLYPAFEMIICQLLGPIGIELPGAQKLKYKRTCASQYFPTPLVSIPSPSPPQASVISSKKFSTQILTMPARYIKIVRRVGSTSQKWSPGVKIGSPSCFLCLTDEMIKCILTGCEDP